ncbi:MAG: 4Fe-4S dicluster domain-containing protein [Planctomycetes bacterium]|nr:4Fe-4S dicluster domain-containing protein [Planctomycetota bacterium]
MIAKNRAFPGGYRFKHFQGRPQDKLIKAAIPAMVTIPLMQGFGDEVAAVVGADDKVAAGQTIGRDDESISSPVHSSVNGKVVNIGKIDYLGNETTAITIESDGTEGWQSLEGCSAAWDNLSIEQIEKLVYLSGASGAGRDGIPTGFNSSIISPDEVENVIIHGVESEMFAVSSGLLLKDDNLSHFAEGTKILRKMLPHAAFSIALNSECKSLITDVSGALADNDWCDVRGLEPRYPADYDEVLVSAVLGREFPVGHLAANIGVIVLDIQAVLAVYDAVVAGKAVIERTIALAGPGFKENLHISARVGSPVQHIIDGMVKQDADLRFLRNSCLTGEALSDLSMPADRTCGAIIAVVEGNNREMFAFVRPGPRKDSYSRTFLSLLFGSEKITKLCETNLRGEERPCISCNYCVEVCPVSLMPHLLFRHVEREIIDEKLLKYGIYDCIECNLCTYVCPSKITLGQWIKDGKAKLIDEGLPCPQPKFALKGLEEDEDAK